MEFEKASQFDVHSETIAGGATGGAVKIQAGRRVSVAIHPAGTAAVDYTISAHADIDAAAANWTEWADGNVTASTSDALNGPVTGVRGRSISGAATFEVLSEPLP